MNDIQEKWNQIKESIRTEYELTNNPVTVSV